MMIKNKIFLALIYGLLLTSGARGAKTRPAPQREHAIPLELRPPALSRFQVQDVSDATLHAIARRYTDRINAERNRQQTPPVPAAQQPPEDRHERRD